MPSPQLADPLDALMQQHGAASAPAVSVPDDLDALMQSHGAAPADFRTSNAKDAGGDAEVDPNSLGTFVKHVGAQLNPLAMVRDVASAIQTQGVGGTIKAIGAAQGALFDQAKASYQAGDYATAARHFINYLLPVIGPGLDRSSDLLEAGKWAAGGGDAIGLGLSLFGPKGLEGIAAGKYPLGATAAKGAVSPSTARPEIQFAQQRGIPLDAATVSDNFAVKGAQGLADRTYAGSLVATPANTARAAAMAQTGQDLASEVHPAPTTPESAGTSLRAALTEKVAGHATEANTAYDRLRELEQRPASQLEMPVTRAPAKVDALDPVITGQLRRIVHEMDASGYTPRLLQPTKYGGSLEHVEGTGGAGAKVFDDIKQNLSPGSSQTRGDVQAALESYLGGGPETAAVKAAIEVARARYVEPHTVSRAELPISEMRTPTRLEGTRPSTAPMGFPVDLPEAKRALQPLYDQLKRQMPITQQQANPGLKAIQNILESPDYAPLSQVDRDLSAIKAVARTQGGLAKLAVTHLEAAVQEAARHGGPDVVDALTQGRAATIAKYGASDVLDTLHAEPVRSIDALTANSDVAIQRLRRVVAQVPDQAPVIARGYLEDLLTKPNKVAEWKKLGTQTRAVLFPDQSAALDQFFALTDRISKTNVNPSGSGHVLALGAQGALFITNPIEATTIQISGAAVAKLLRSRPALDALTRGLSVSVSAPAATKAAAVAKLVQVAADAGVPLTFPRAADRGSSQ